MGYKTIYIRLSAVKHSRVSRQMKNRKPLPRLIVTQSLKGFFEIISKSNFASRLSITSIICSLGIFSVVNSQDFFVKKYGQRIWNWYGGNANKPEVPKTKKKWNFECFSLNMSKWIKRLYPHDFFNDEKDIWTNYISKNIFYSLFYEDFFVDWMFICFKAMYVFSPNNFGAILSCAILDHPYVRMLKTFSISFSIIFVRSENCVGLKICFARI